ncbi:MAG: hypothetical protein ACM3W7_00130, partial [Acidobacteriota bacterium]
MTLKEFSRAGLFALAFAVLLGLLLSISGDGYAQTPPPAPAAAATAAPQPACDASAKPPILSNCKTDS